MPCTKCALGYGEAVPLKYRPRVTYLCLSPYGVDRHYHLVLLNALNQMHQQAYLYVTSLIFLFGIGGCMHKGGCLIVGYQAYPTNYCARLLACNAIVRQVYEFMTNLYNFVKLA